MMIKKGPWTVTGTREVYANAWIKVREDQVIRPDGRDGIFGVVTLRPGASVLPMDDDGNVFLTKEYHYGVERETIEVVSGGIEGEESPLETAKRELLEEAGIEAKEWTDLGVIDPFTTVINSANHMFLAKGLTFFKANPEGTEKITVVKTTFDQAVAWVREGKITHAATVTLILKVKAFL